MLIELLRMLVENARVLMENRDDLAELIVGHKNSDDYGGILSHVVSIFQLFSGRTMKSIVR